MNEQPNQPIIINPEQLDRIATLLGKINDSLDVFLTAFNSSPTFSAAVLLILFGIGWSSAG